MLLFVLSCPHRIGLILQLFIGLSCVYLFCLHLGRNRIVYGVHFMCTQCERDAYIFLIVRVFILLIEERIYCIYIYMYLYIQVTILSYKCMYNRQQHAAIIVGSSVRDTRTYKRHVDTHTDRHAKYPFLV